MAIDAVWGSVDTNGQGILRRATLAIWVYPESEQMIVLPPDALRLIAECGNDCAKLLLEAVERMTESCELARTDRQGENSGSD